MYSSQLRKITPQVQRYCSSTSITSFSDWKCEGGEGGGVGAQFLDICNARSMGKVWYEKMKNENFFSKFSYYNVGTLLIYNHILLGETVWFFLFAVSPILNKRKMLWKNKYADATIFTCYKRHWAFIQFMSFHTTCLKEFITFFTFFLIDLRNYKIETTKKE